MFLDMTSLRDAIAQGEEALAYCGSDLVRSDPRLALHLRAAAIQAFEFTYELTIKTLRRFLTEVEANPGAVEALSFNDLVRRGYDLGLLHAELAAWRAFRRDRGTTSHTCDAVKAQAISESIPAFMAEARFLLASIEARQVHEPQGGPP